MDAKQPVSDIVLRLVLVAPVNVLVVQEVALESAKVVKILAASHVLLAVNMNARVVARVVVLKAVGTKKTKNNFTSPIMKENDNKELQSRRQFFKKAAKATLPILGSIALLHMPLEVFASSTEMGCNRQSPCTGSCYQTCGGTCRGRCSRECGGSCQGRCTNSCTGSCSSGCVGGCSGSCESTCSGGCDSRCSGACKHLCDSACQSDCTGSCKNYCPRSCYGGNY